MNCAFCKAPDPKWIFPMADVSAWPTCDYCKSLIEAEASTNLVDYIVNVFLGSHDLTREEVMLPEIELIARREVNSFLQFKAGSAVPIPSI